MKTRYVLAALSAALALAGCGGAAASTPTAHSPSTATAAAPNSLVGVGTPDAEQLAAAMKLTDVDAFNATTDPNHLLGRQGEYTSKINWGNWNNDQGDYGSIEVFGNTTDMNARLSYLSVFRAPFGDGYDYSYQSAILRLSDGYTPSQARVLRLEFDAAVNQLEG